MTNETIIYKLEYIALLVTMYLTESIISVFIKFVFVDAIIDKDVATNKTAACVIYME